MANNISGDLQNLNHSFEPFSNKLKGKAPSNSQNESSQTSGIVNNVEKNIAINEAAKVEAAKIKEAKQQSKDEASKIEEAVATISEFMSLPIRSVNFTQDDGTDKTVIKVFDSENKELIKQFPSEEVLEIAQKIVDLRQDVDNKAGILLDESI